MARVVDGVGARAVIDSVDMVSRIEVTVVCIPSQQFVRGRRQVVIALSVLCSHPREGWV